MLIQIEFELFLYNNFTKVSLCWSWLRSSWQSRLIPLSFKRSLKVASGNLYFSPSSNNSDQESYSSLLKISMNTACDTWLGVRWSVKTFFSYWVWDVSRHVSSSPCQRWKHFSTCHLYIGCRFFFSLDIPSSALLLSWISQSLFQFIEFTLTHYLSRFMWKKAPHRFLSPSCVC